MDKTIDQRVRQSYDRQAAMARIGAVLTQVAPGEVTIELPYRPDLTQQHGFFHAGIVTMIVDTACGYAAYTLMPAGSAVLTVEYKVNFISPAAGEKLVGRGWVIKPGRTLTVCQGEVHALNDGSQKLVATMLATMITREDSGLEG